MAGRETRSILVFAPEDRFSAALVAAVIDWKRALG